MQIVRDTAGRTYQVLKRSATEWLVRELETGEEMYRPASNLEVVDDASALRLSTEAVPEPVRTVLTAVRDDRSLGFLLELDREGPLAVRTMLDRYDFCESNLHGLLAEFQAAGLLEPQSVAGERGYATTAVASAAIEHLTRDD